MPRGEHGGVVNDTNPESERRRERASGAKKPPVRLCPELRKSTNEPGVVTWQEMRNLFYIMIFDQKYKTNWDLTTWTDFAKRTRARSELFTELGMFKR